MNKKDCKIVQDLLPNYIENLTKEETSKYIEEHIKECEECKELLDKMRTEIKSNDEKRDLREVKYMKKFKNKIRILKFIILLIVLLLILAFILIIGRRFFIMKDISKKSQDINNFSNLHIIEYYYYEGNLIIMEQYKLDDKVKYVITEKNNDEFVIQTQYGKRNVEKYSKENNVYTGNIYLDIEGKKYASLNVDTRSFEQEKLNSVLYTKNYFDLFKYSLSSNITETKFCGKDSYCLTNIPSYIGGIYERVFIDKETGLMVGSSGYDSTLNISDGDIMTIETIYEYGTVTEEDFNEPDSNEYEIVDNIYQVIEK